MAIGKALSGKSYAGNPRVRFDEGGSRTGGNAEARGSTLRKENVFRRMLARKCLGAELLFLVLALTCPSAFSVTNVRWCGTEGDYTNPDMWDGGVVPSTGTDCADLSRTSAGEAVGYIRDGMNITNGWINCGRTNDFTLVMSGGHIVDGLQTGGRRPARVVRPRDGPRSRRRIDGAFRVRVASARRPPLVFRQPGQSRQRRVYGHCPVGIPESTSEK